MLGHEHPDTLYGVTIWQGSIKPRAAMARPSRSYKRALEANENACLGTGASRYALSVNNLGVLYQAQGRYSEAEPLYKRALAASERVLGPEHPDTLRSVNNLGVLYQAQGRYSEAEAAS